LCELFLCFGKVVVYVLLCFVNLFLVFGNIHVHVLLCFVDCLMSLTAGRPRQAQACPGMPRHHQGGWRLFVWCLRNERSGCSLLNMGRMITGQLGEEIRYLTASEAKPGSKGVVLG